MSAFKPIALIKDFDVFGLLTQHNKLIQGKINSVGTVTLTNGGTTTTLTDIHIVPVSVILFWAQTANAAAVSGSLWYDVTSIAMTGGKVTLNHSSSAHNDLTFGYAVFA